MMDVKIGRVLASDSVEMTTVNRLWQETTLEERRAWHRVTCQNSRALADVRLVKVFSDRLEAALAAVVKN
jgi:hypothetical protein